MSRDRRPKGCLARISRQRTAPLFGDIVLGYLPWGKRGCIAVLYLHEVGLTCRQGLLRFLESAQHLGVSSNISLHLEHVLVDLIFRVWQHGHNEIC